MRRLINTIPRSWHPIISILRQSRPQLSIDDTGLTRKTFVVTEDANKNVWLSWNGRCLSTWKVWKIKFGTSHVQLSRLMTKPTKWLCTQQIIYLKKKKIDCAPSKDSDQLIRGFAVRSLDSYEPKRSSWGQRRLIRLWGCPGWSKSSLGAQLFYWFCHEEAQIISLHEACWMKNVLSTQNSNADSFCFKSIHSFRLWCLTINLSFVQN